jgi:hypothetical protein
VGAAVMKHDLVKQLTKTVASKDPIG